MLSLWRCSGHWNGECKTHKTSTLIKSTWIRRLRTVQCTKTTWIERKPYSSTGTLTLDIIFKKTNWPYLYLAEINFKLSLFQIRNSRSRVPKREEETSRNQKSKNCYRGRCTVTIAQDNPIFVSNVTLESSPSSVLGALDVYAMVQDNETNGKLKKEEVILWFDCHSVSCSHAFSHSPIFILPDLPLFHSWSHVAEKAEEATHPLFRQLQMVTEKSNCCRILWWNNKHHKVAGDRSDSKTHPRVFSAWVSSWPSPHSNTITHLCRGLTRNTCWWMEGISNYFETFFMAMFVFCSGQIQFASSYHLTSYPTTNTTRILIQGWDEPSPSEAIPISSLDSIRAN